MTADDIRRAMGRDEKMLYAAILCLYDHQTNEEKRKSKTKESNGRGFNAPDTKKMSYFARLILAGNKLYPSQVQEARDRMLKYSGQLAAHFGWRDMFQVLKKIKPKAK